MKKGADIGYQDPLSRDTALHLAIKNPHKEIIELLLNQKDIQKVFDMRDKNGDTPMRAALFMDAIRDSDEIQFFKKRQKMGKVREQVLSVFFERTAKFYHISLQNR